MLQTIREMQELQPLKDVAGIANQQLKVKEAYNSKKAKCKLNKGSIDDEYAKREHQLDMEIEAAHTAFN